MNTIQYMPGVTCFHIIGKHRLISHRDAVNGYLLTYPIDVNDWLSWPNIPIKH